MKLIQPNRRTTSYGLRLLSYLGSKLWNDVVNSDPGIANCDFKDLMDFLPYLILSNIHWSCQIVLRFYTEHSHARCKISKRLDNWNIRYGHTKFQGWGLLGQFPPFRYFPNFSASPKYMLAIVYHVHIWQVLPQLSCGDTCQIWMWCKWSNRYFDRIENFAYGEINERSFSNPHPRWFGSVSDRTAFVRGIETR